MKKGFYMKKIRVLLLVTFVGFSTSLFSLDEVSPDSRVVKANNGTQVAAVTKEDLAAAEKNLEAIVKEVDVLKKEADSVEQDLKKEKDLRSASASPEMASKIKDLESKKELLKKQYEDACASREGLQNQLLVSVVALQKVLTDASEQENKVAGPSSQQLKKETVATSNGNNASKMGVPQTPAQQASNAKNVANAKKGIVGAKKESKKKKNRRNKHRKGKKNNIKQSRKNSGLNKKVSKKTNKKIGKKNKVKRVSQKNKRKNQNKKHK